MTSNVQKNADARFACVVADGDNFAVGRGDNHVASGDLPFGVTEKPEAEQGNQVERRPQPGVEEIRQRQARQGQPAGIINSVGNNTQYLILSCVHATAWGG